jgi:sugar lactone lactonase YvrE
MEPATQQLALAGRVIGGQQPVSGSTIQLWAVGTTGDGSSATALLSPAVPSDANGNFSITGLFTCPSSSSLVYITATGGNPGLSGGSSNPNLTMLTPLGQCGNLSNSTSVIINELTTVAAVGNLAPYMNSYAAVGSSTAHASQLSSAFALINEFANSSNGQTPGPTLPAGYYASTVEINTLGDILAACVNSAGGVAGDGTACGTLFSLSTPSGGPAPTETIGAALQIFKNPTAISSALLNLVSANPPYQPTLSSAPASWGLQVIPYTATPSITPAGGTYASAQMITLADATNGATIYYTTNGVAPTTTASSVYTGPFYVPASATIKAFAMAPGDAASGLASASYVITSPVTAAAPVFSPGAGAYSVAPKVTITTSTTGAAIYYTTDGSTPTTASTAYTGPVTISTSETLSAIAGGNGYVSSPVTSAAYLINGFGIINTVAGNGTSGSIGDGGPATSAELVNAAKIAVDAAGNLYIADQSNRVRKVTPAGIITTVAGNGSYTDSGDGGQATSAGIALPYALAVDSNNNLYISELYGYKIRKVTPAGVISTVAGTGTSGFSGDNGPATSATMKAPYGIAVDAAGNLYIADSGNNRIRKVSNGTITTIAGIGTAGFSGDNGLATSASINAPYGVAVDASGNVFIADQGNNRIRKVTGTTITTYAGTGANTSTGDGGPATSATFYSPQDVAVDASGTVYFSDANYEVVRAVTPSGIINTVAGYNLGSGFSGDGGPALGAKLSSPRGLALDKSGDLYISDESNYRVREVTYQATQPVVPSPVIVSPNSGAYTSAQSVTITESQTGAAIYYTTDGTTPTSSSILYSGAFTVASSATVNAVGIQLGWKTSPVSSATYTINYPSTPLFTPGTGTYNSATQVAITSGLSGASIYYTTDGSMPSSASTLYTAPITVGASETLNAIAIAGGTSSSVATAVYTINTVGIITTIAGTLNQYGYAGDGGPALGAQLYAVNGLAMDASGDIYLGDLYNRRVREIDTTNTINTIAGNGSQGYSGDGGPASAAVLENPQGLLLDSGNLYIADAQYVRVINSSGIISTFAGGGTPSDNVGDGGAPTAAILGDANSIIKDRNGNFYIADGSRVRKISNTGIITTVAGSGSTGYSGDGGLATKAGLSFAAGLALDAAGNLYIADQNNYVIRKVTPAGIISTIAGNGSSGYSGDGGPATSALLGQPSRMTFDSAGNLIFCDSYGARIRKITPAGIISTIAGIQNGAESGDGGPAIDANLSQVQAIYVDASNNIYLGGYDTIRKITFQATQPTAAAPTFTPPAGTYTTGQTVTISSTASTPTIYYTTDGTTPTTSSTLYSNPVSVSANKTLKAIAVSPGYINSPVATAAYVIAPLAATPTFSIAGGTYYTAQTVTISSTTTGPGAAIYYTIDGTTPTSASTLYTGAITVAVAETIKAIATATGYTASNVGSATYNITVSTPVFTPAAATYTTTENVVISSATNGVSFYYTLDGTTPTTSSTPYTGPVNVSTSETLQAIGIKTGLVNSAPASGFYEIDLTPAVAPTFSLANGTYTNSQLLTLTSSTTGAKFYYTTDGSAPTISSTLYTAPIAVNSTETVKAITKATNYQASGVTTGSYTINVGTMSTFAGNGTSGFSGDNGAATSAEVDGVVGLAMDSSGNIYFADRTNQRIRKVTPGGVITTVAGNGIATYNGDNIAATSASLYYPTAVAISSSGDIYIADSGNNRVRKVSGGIITTVAGTTSGGYNGDGIAATSAQLNQPLGVALDSFGNLYITDDGNGRVRKVVNGTISTLVSGRVAPQYITVDGSNNVYFSDYEQIYKVTSGGTLSVFAGNGGASYNGDNIPATSAQLLAPEGVATDSAGNVYIADEANARIRKVIVATGIITTIAGNGTTGYNGDGISATAAELNNPYGVLVDSSGNLYIGDYYNFRVRKITH